MRSWMSAMAGAAGRVSSAQESTASPSGACQRAINPAKAMTGEPVAWMKQGCFTGPPPPLSPTGRTRHSYQPRAGIRQRERR